MSAGFACRGRICKLLPSSVPSALAYKSPWLRTCVLSPVLLPNMAKSSPWNVTERAMCYFWPAGSEGGWDLSTPEPDPVPPHPCPLSICCTWCINTAHNQALKLCLRVFLALEACLVSAQGKMERSRNECSHDSILNQTPGMRSQWAMACCAPPGGNCLPETPPAGTPVTFLVVLVCACSVAKSCPPLCDPMDCSPSGSSVQGISQARVL